MSLSHYDPLANLRLFRDAFSRMLTEPQPTAPGRRRSIFTRPKTNWF